MRTGIALLVPLLTLTACSSPAVGAQASPAPADEGAVHLVEHERSACRLCDLYLSAQGWVVRIEAGDSLGTGVVVTASGRAVTNAHVVGDLARVSIETFDRRRFTATVVATDRTEDLALLQIDAPETRWTPVAIETGQLTPVGSEVYAIGHPLGLDWTLTRGIVSGYREIGPVRMMQTDAPISPGNSGGPLLDEHGHLVGIVTSKAAAAGAENLAFARPAAALLAFLERSGI